MSLLSSKVGQKVVHEKLFSSAQVKVMFLIAREIPAGALY